jgi:carbon monoxide dehydrogenase subunit G
MGFASEEIEITKAPDEVWAVAGDFGGIGAWMPGLSSCVVDGDDRLLTMGGMEITERLERRDEETRELVYAIVGGVPVANHRATITVEPSAKGSRVTWAVEVEPDELTELMRVTYAGALQALKEHLGG